MSTKAWYWLGLGILALSLGSSSTVRLLVTRASAAAAATGIGSAPLGSLVQSVRTGAGCHQKRAWNSELASEESQLEAESSRIEAEMAEGELSEAETLASEWDGVRARSGSSQSVVVRVPSVSVEQGGRICPRMRVHISAPAVPASPVVEGEDPI